MNAKKFIFVVLLFGLIKICHASTNPNIKTFNNQLAANYSQSNTLSIYPCISALGANQGTTPQSLTGGLMVKFTF